MDIRLVETDYDILNSKSMEMCINNALEAVRQLALLMGPAIVDQIILEWNKKTFILVKNDLEKLPNQIRLFVHMASVVGMCSACKVICDEAQERLGDKNE